MEWEAKDIVLASDFVASLLPNLECPICRTFFDDPESWCPHGHLICRTCQLQLTRQECPICKTPHQDSPVKNLGLRQVMAKLRIRCQDCATQHSILTYRVHTTHCLGRPVPCFGSKAFREYHRLNHRTLPSCTYETNNIADLLDHVRDHHHAVVTDAKHPITLDPKTGLFNDQSPSLLLNYVDEKTQTLIGLLCTFPPGPIFAITLFHYTFTPLRIDLDLTLRNESQPPIHHTSSSVVGHALTQMNREPLIYRKELDSIHLSIAHVVPHLSPISTTVGSTGPPSTLSTDIPRTPSTTTQSGSASSIPSRGGLPHRLYRTSLPRDGGPLSEEME